MTEIPHTKKHPRYKQVSVPTDLLDRVTALYPYAYASHIVRRALNDLLAREEGEKRSAAPVADGIR